MHRGLLANRSVALQGWLGSQGYQDLLELGGRLVLG